MDSRKIIRNILNEAVQPAQLASVASALGMGQEELRTQVEDIDPTKTNKYAGYILKVLRGDPGLDDNALRDKLVKYSKALKGNLLEPGDRDILRFQTLDDLDVALQKTEGKQSKSQLKKKSQDKRVGGSTLVHDKAGLLVYAVHTPEDAALHGRGGPWCVQNLGMAKSYLEGGSPLYFFYIQSDLVKRLDPSLRNKMDQYSRGPIKGYNRFACLSFTSPYDILGVQYASPYFEFENLTNAGTISVDDLDSDQFEAYNNAQEDYIGSIKSIPETVNEQIEAWTAGKIGGEVREQTVEDAWGRTWSFHYEDGIMDTSGAPILGRYGEEGEWYTEPFQDNLDAGILDEFEMVKDYDSIQNPFYHAEYYVTWSPEKTKEEVQKDVMRELAKAFKGSRYQEVLDNPDKVYPYFIAAVEREHEGKVAPRTYQPISLYGLLGILSDVEEVSFLVRASVLEAESLLGVSGLPFYPTSYVNGERNEKVAYFRWLEHENWTGLEQVLNFKYSLKYLDFYENVAERMKEASELEVYTNQVVIPVLKSLDKQYPEHRSSIDPPYTVETWAKEECARVIDCHKQTILTPNVDWLTKYPDKATLFKWLETEVKEIIETRRVREKEYKDEIDKSAQEIEMVLDKIISGYQKMGQNPEKAASIQNHIYPDVESILNRVGYSVSQDFPMSILPATHKEFMAWVDKWDKSFLSLSNDFRWVLDKLHYVLSHLGEDFPEEFG